MNITELESNLKKDYDLVAFVDLADLQEQHRAVYDLFIKVRKDTFADKERIVLYSENKPDEEFLKHISYAAKLIDIGEFFILIVCPYKLDTTLQSMICPVTNTKNFTEPNYVVNDSLCPLPFAMLFMDQDNRVRPCCKFEGQTGTVENRSFAEEFANKNMEKIRQLMREGKKPDSCSRCWHVESLGVTSFRQHALVKYEKQLHTEWLDNPKLRDLNWAPSRLCNFKCRICKSEDSTSIASEEVKITTDNNRKNLLYEFLRKEKNNQNSIRIVKYLENLPELEYLHIVGGEPLMWPDLETCIDTLIQSGQSKNIVFECNTNGSHWPDTIITKMKNNFKETQFLISIDDVGKRFENTRGGKWEQVSDNLQKFKSLQDKNFKCTIVLTVNLHNVLYLESVIDLANDLEFQLIWWYLEKPYFLSIDNATEKTILEVQKKYANHSDPELRNIAARMLASKPSDGKEFIAYSNTIDQRRNQKFSESHSEVYTAMSINTLL